MNITPENVSSLRELLRWLERNSDALMERYARYPEPQDKTRVFKHLEIQFLSAILERKQVSNSVKCPRGGVTNWERDTDYPMTYPGWEGEVSFQAWGENVPILCSLVEGTGIHLDQLRGDLAKKNFTGRFYIFDYDFPFLKEDVDHFEL